MSGFNTKERNNNGEYEITFYSDNKDDFKIVENLCRSLIGHNKPNTEGDLISREWVKTNFAKEFFKALGSGNDTPFEVFGTVKKVIDNAPTVEIPVARWDCYCEGQKVGYEKALSEIPKGKWYDFIPNCLKARHGDYVLYKVDFLLDNLAREVNIMEGARRMKGDKI